jgi:hypothetical protein
MPANDMYCTQKQCTSPICDFVLNPCVRVGDKTYEGALATHYAAETGEIYYGKNVQVVFVFALFYNESIFFTNNFLQY